LRTTDATALAQDDNVPVFLSRQLGKGGILTLNFHLGRALGALALQASDPVERFLVSLCRLGGVAPRYDFDGSRYVVNTFTNRKLTLLTMLRSRRYGRTADNEGRVSIGLSRWYHVYNQRMGQYLGRADEVFFSGREENPMIYALLDARPESEWPTPVFSDNAQRGTIWGMHFPGATAMSGHTLRVDVLAPDGTELEHYRDYVTLSEEQTAFELPLALDDPPGRWWLLVEDLASRHTRSYEMTVD
jgi:hypothetical protein